MSTPWPDDVFDCALRLARSLGYREIHIWPLDGRVYVYRPKGRGDWRELDPRDPTVWGALIGPHGVGSLFFWKSNYLSPGRYSDRTSYHPGLAVCEVYNDLKGKPLEKYIDIPRVAFVTKKSGY